MEFSRTFRVAFLVTVYLSVLAFADLNEDKKNALKTVDTQYESNQKLLVDTKEEVNKRAGYLKIIEKYWRDFGYNVTEDSNVKAQKTSKTGFLMADLLKSSANVVKCIQMAEREALEDNKYYFTRDFLKHLGMHDTEESRRQQRVIYDWEQDMKSASTKYAGFYEKAKDEIKAAKDKSAISTALKEFKYFTNNMADYIVDIYFDLNRIHARLVDYILSYVPCLIDYDVRRHDQLVKEIQICFSKY